MAYLIHRLFIICLTFWASTCIAGADLAKITWMSEQYPPYNWRPDANSAPKGMFIDLVMDALGDAVDSDRITFYPWARSYRLIKKKPDMALFAMTDTPERRKLFTLSDPVMPSVVGIICNTMAIARLIGQGKLSPDYAQGMSLDDPSPIPYLRIGVVREDIGEQLLKKAPLRPKRVVRGNSLKALVRKMYHGRIDAIAYNTHVAGWMFKSKDGNYKNFRSKNFKLAYVLGRKPMVFAFSKSIDPKVVKLFNARIKEWKESGKIEATIKSYLD